MRVDTEYRCITAFSPHCCLPSEPLGGLVFKNKCPNWFYGCVKMCPASARALLTQFVARTLFVTGAVTVFLQINCRTFCLFLQVVSYHMHSLAVDVLIVKYQWMCKK